MCECVCVGLLGWGGCVGQLSAGGSCRWEGFFPIAGPIILTEVGGGAGVGGVGVNVCACLGRGGDL